MFATASMDFHEEITRKRIPYRDMTVPQSLQHIARLICVQNLLDLTNGKDVTEYLKLAYHSAVTEDILNHMVQFYPKKLTNEILAGLASPHIKNLRLVNCIKIELSEFIKIVPTFKKLNGLDLKKCNQMLRPTFDKIIKMADLHLTSLSVEDCTDVNDFIVRTILKNLPYLRYLNVSLCYYITDNAFLLDKDQFRRREHIVKNDDSTEVVYPCSLTSIDVYGCIKLTNQGIRNLAYLTGPTLHVCLSYTRVTLECLLYLSGFDVLSMFLKDNDELNDTQGTVSNGPQNFEKQETPACDKKYAISPIEKGNPQLDSLDYYYFPLNCCSPKLMIRFYFDSRFAHEFKLFMPADLLIDLTKDSKSKQRQSNVKKVSMPQNKRIYTPTIRSIDLTDVIHPSGKQEHMENALETFVTENPCLQTVKLSWPKFPNYLLKHIVDSCVDLRELTLVGCHVIDAEHICYVGSQSRKLTKLEHKKDFATLPQSETDFNDVTFVKMMAKLTENLNSLDISCCKNLTESDINSFLCKQSYLTSFSFREGALSDLSLEMLCDNFKQLRSVNLAGVKSITGSGLINLAKHLCHLDFIDLSRASCSSLQDDVIEAFLTHCPRLNQIQLDGQSLLTSVPFLPIISDYHKWSKYKAMYFIKTKEKYLETTTTSEEETDSSDEDLETTTTSEEETDSSDEEYEALRCPHRSTMFATNLQHLSLWSCNSIADSDMEDIVTVCRGSLTIIDCHGDKVKTRLLRPNKF